MWSNVFHPPISKVKFLHRFPEVSCATDKPQRPQFIEQLLVYGVWILWIITGWWFPISFNFHPYLGKWSKLTNIFQMGWNHQLVLDFSTHEHMSRVGLIIPLIVYTLTIHPSLCKYLVRIGVFRTPPILEVIIWGPFETDQPTPRVWLQELIFKKTSRISSGFPDLIYFMGI